MSEKSNGKAELGRVVSWSSDIEAVAGPKLSGDNWKSWLARAARNAGITFPQCKALYYGDVSDPKYSVGSKLKEAAERARQEARLLASQYESLAGKLNASDANLHSEEVLALVQAARRLRGVDRA